ncbi:7-cyano-7-deazaguanine synthase [Xanthomonas nasturtii]|uniref:7-cyano-7-deazaguanine synthase n=1 Tax=Xanthomonas nasturtii TaxID=1843581 RepID=A0A3E1KEJ6_9XANT|nr:Qat anti-phage system QueC-like protein QatC [Xanthomonas nasturtii]MCL1532663.1 7-cyano-7-deazaguanine synthase [Xanthomonas nasturtii]MCL1567453.1 7-cyano-7-deazaguanine synthase [Xanthomonas nasturtii]MCL1571317.1 7-cyano-7-deazaguanine synthase [Xanthomonas nasturtii]MCL1575181.1 7-cyano-7-deazaguanine synthase [Xanthomonas nasturtii]MCL1582866.1 7-cyano-7-deazaguanine synthase [Xanthomonas nasturtii]
MKIFSAPRGVAVPAVSDLQLILYGQPDRHADGTRSVGSAGAAIETRIQRLRYAPAPRAWDFLSLALSVVGADLSVHRAGSPDGWTRQIDLITAVGEPDFWNSEAHTIEAALRFLSTDVWTLEFVGKGRRPDPPDELFRPTEDSVCLLSGGMDSLIGAIDLAESGRRSIAVSNTVPGDGHNQHSFAEAVGFKHLALNHNASPPSDGGREPSQRARSIIFLAFGVLAATSLQAYQDGAQVPLFICENGFIALNPPLTGTRLGSLSTRTAHPEFLHGVQSVLDAADLRVKLVNPYQHKTKGEMSRECADQDLLRNLAASSVSCGRYRRYGYNQCGRCIPCQIRRAAYLAWGQPDPTDYTFKDIGRREADYAHFDDVRSVAMAISRVNREGLEAWLRSALSYPHAGPRAPLRDVIQRGLGELMALHQSVGLH